MKIFCDDFTILLAGGNRTRATGWWVYLQDVPHLKFERRTAFSKFHTPKTMNSAIQRIRNCKNGILDLSDLGLTRLPPIPPTIKTLRCQGNSLSVLPPLHNGLEVLDFTRNFVNFLPPLPATVTTLKCQDNLLRNLPPLPTGLQRFLCDRNDILQLPTLPDSLRILGCSRNLLTSLPLLPSNLQWIDCRGNLFMALPVKFPTSVRRVYCTQFSIIPLYE